MLPDMIGGYRLGSATETISFGPDEVSYGGAGAAHAVDLDAPVNAHAASMGYALCGTPVRIWPDEPFDPSASEAHDRCVALTGIAAPDRAPSDAISSRGGDDGGRRGRQQRDATE